MTLDDTYCYINSMPTEVLLIIFSYLKATELTSNRRVCIRWKNIIDELVRSDELWRSHCKIDFKKHHEIAKRKARAGVSWFHIYRSLTLWPRILQARERRDEFAAASGISEEILNFKILRDGILGVHKRGSIVYYDIETLEQTKQRSISGEYAKYTENDEFIIILSYQLHLFVIRKTIENPNHETNATFDDVKTFLVVGKKIYYVNLYNEVFLCCLDDGELKNRYITSTECRVMALSYTTRLHILTYDRIIYTLWDHQLVYSRELNTKSGLLHILRDYNLLGQMDWHVYNQWMYTLNRNTLDFPLTDVVCIRMYGDITFVGTSWGVLRIYCKPVTVHNGELNLFETSPCKQYNFTPRPDCPVLSTCPILKIDVMETETGHTVIVAMPKKIAVIDFTHCFKRTASVAMLPYDDMQKVKMLKITGTEPTIVDLMLAAEQTTLAFDAHVQ